MYRLLIVDDEEIITDGLYEVFSRFMPDQLDVCKAYSGKEALDWMMRTRIDIVLTDIAMPGMNGLELMDSIQAYWPRCKVIFLTGHSNFEYAYQAIQQPHVRYLLKTEGYDKVTETVSEVMSEIEQRKSESILVEKSREQIYAYEFMAQGDFMRHLLQDSKVICSNQNEIVKEFQKLNIALDPTKGVLMILGRLTYPKGKTYTEKSEILSSVRATWDIHFSGKVHSIGIVDKFGDILWLIQPFSDTKEKLDHYLLQFLEGTIEIIQEECLSSLGLTIGFTVSGECCEWERVTKKYEQLRQLQLQKIGDGIPVILRDCPEQTGECTSHERMVTSNKIEIMASHLETNRAAEFLEELEQLGNYSQNGNALQMTETYFSIAIVLYSYINKLGWHSRIDKCEKLLRLDDHTSMKEGFQYLRGITEEIFKLKQTDERDRATCVVDRICQYIETHLNEDLSLVRLAEIHYFNPSYLSYFFKQECGINLSEYIDKCRIRKAKELLLDGDLKIREVSAAVGYNAAHSFTRFFKKVTGMTPKEYRDTLLQIQNNK
ncbi:two-component system response regulator YesN [Evansella vedderi]|uniref:Two-component system response regulator YesN n=1 Tax=Evansella vedderi TaxID=38282 RepID=A0ABT9ZPP8_9BACI|nr:response regulator [Evansella vedderi]MDQ0253214.1 two-component system response regulator YesN [Evansella vedderi]